MIKNVGGLDRVLRIVIGLGLMVLAATGQVGAWGWVGLIVLATGAFSFCGAYALIGANTCPVKQETKTDTL
jgi:ABC-type branched-subunit amino acid transport system permease subunit